MKEKLMKEMCNFKDPGNELMLTKSIKVTSD